jgi:hypothetical protein
VHSCFSALLLTPRRWAYVAVVTTTSVALDKTLYGPCKKPQTGRRDPAQDLEGLGYRRRPFVLPNESSRPRHEHTEQR